MFTACYSAILTTAAVVDAKFKDDRRKEWDRLITEAKSLPIEKNEGHDCMPTGEIPRNGGEESAERSRPVPAVWDGLHWATATRAKAGAAATKAQVVHWTPLLGAPEEKKPASRNPVAKASGYDDYDPLLPPRDPQNEMQIRKVEETILSLVNQLLLQSRDNSSVVISELENHERAVLFAQRQQIWKQIDELRDGDTPLPSYAHLDLVLVRQGQAELHESMVALFDQVKDMPARVDVILAKICYNLLISTAPPNITTYNILIDYFTRLKRHDLAQIVVDSFLNETRYRPNSTTVALILDHFAAKGDSNGFKDIIKRMGGLKGDMRIMKRPLHTLAFPSVQEWALNNKVIHRSGFLIQKVPRNARIYNSLIEGCLSLTDKLSAIRYLRAALRDGYPVKPDLFYRIAKACIFDADRHASECLLYTILLQWEGTVSPNHGIEYDVASRYAIYQIIGRSRVDIDSTKALPLPSDVTRKSLRRLIRHMRIISLAESVDRFSEASSAVECLLTMKTTEDLAQKLRAYSTVLKSLGSYIRPTDTSECVSLAIQIIKAPGLIENDRAMRKERRNIRYRELVWQMEKINSMQRTLLPISYDRLSPQAKSKYDASTSKDRKMSIPNRMTLLLSLHRETNNKISSTSNYTNTHDTYSQLPLPQIQVPDLPQQVESSVGSLSASYTVIPRAETEAWRPIWTRA